MTRGARRLLGSVRGSWCEATVAELDRSREWLLAGYHARGARHARRWFRWQTQRLAGLIDPDPDTPWLPELARVPVGSAGRSDAAAALRRWADDVHEHARLTRAASEGSLYVFTVTDDSLRYTLSHRPLHSVPCPSAVASVTSVPRA
ncbi:hypothetical protein ACTWP5_10650 [Streptomyces sp. 4N509B]|uniref:hypothetical protein n=1 Tax=Streptomyces sp. 4N509B TaxID=3457413 RepID=UPI003FD3BB21